jgi:cysteine-S-conjugate beta-lyase
MNPHVTRDAGEAAAVMPGIGWLRSRRNAKWNTYGRELLPAWIADMDFPVATEILDSLRKILDDSDLGYPLRQGRMDGAVVADAFSRRAAGVYGYEIAPGQVTVAADLVQSFLAILLAYSQPGDRIAAFTPLYPPLLDAIRVTGRSLVELPLELANGRYELNLPALRACLATGPRILAFCNPHNPTGRVFGSRDLPALATALGDTETILVSDEAHADLVYAPHEFVSCLAVPALRPRSVILASATKAWNIAGVRCGVIAFGTRDLRERFHACLPERLLGAPNVFGLDATLAAWRDGEAWRRGILEVLTSNRSRVFEWVESMAGEVSGIPPEGTYLAWLHVPGLTLREPLGDLLARHGGVALSDGAAYGANSESWVRLNFATTPAVLDEILDRLATAVRSARRVK